MKIAVWHNLASGGGKRALYNQVRGLAGLGHELSVFCPPPADGEYLPLSSHAEETVVPLGDACRYPPALEWLIAETRANTWKLRQIPAMLAHAEEFAEAVNGGGYDVVFATSCRMFFTPFAGRFLKVPSLLYLQEPHRALYEASPTVPWVADTPPAHAWWDPRTVRHWIGSAARLHPFRVQAREESLNVRAFDRVLVNSLFSRESVLRALGVESAVCYLGIDSACFAFSDQPRERFVLSTGEFMARKGVEFIIRAVAAAASSPVLVWVANRADAAYLAEARTLAEALGVVLDVRQKVSEEELVHLYQRATAFVYAPRLEPFGLAPLEASACGTPVIAVAEGGVRETIRHMESGLIVESEPAHMAAAIDHLMGDQALARELGRTGARQVRETWTLHAATERLERHLVAVSVGKQVRP